MKITENIYSHLTAKERTQLSFPSNYLKNRGILKGKILDYGCGFGKDVQILKGQGYDIVGYDPYYFPDFPTEKFNTIICHYVLNVLKPEVQSLVLMRVSSLLSENGIAYFTVRRDIVYEGFRIHKIHNKPTFQMLVRLPYESIFSNDNCEIYSYKRIIDQAKSDCKMCSPANEHFICESATAYAIWSNTLLDNGHAMIIPKRHESNYFKLMEREQRACWLVVNEVKSMIEKEYSITDFNVEINVGALAGQSFNHAHIKLVPRK
jgi:ATP adenylyltransferase